MMTEIPYDRNRLPRAQSPAVLAWNDLTQAIGLSWLWLALGWNDILQRYRGSMLGPFWLTIATGVFIARLKAGNAAPAISTLIGTSPQPMPDRVFPCQDFLQKVIRMPVWYGIANRAL